MQNVRQAPFLPYLVRHATAEQSECWLASLHSFIACEARHLLEQHRSYLASKHSFLPPFAAKKVAPKPLGAGVTGEFLLILLRVYHYKAIEVTSNEVSCDNWAVENQYIAPILCPELQWRSKIIECICHTVRKSASDKQRHAKQHGKHFALTSKCYNCSHDKSTSYSQKTTSDWTDVESGLKYLLSWGG